MDRTLDKKFHTPGLEEVEDIHLLGGTILGSSRTNVDKIKDGFEIAKKSLADTGIDVLVSPNPFNPITTISYSIAVSGNVTLAVYNIT